MTDLLQPTVYVIAGPNGAGKTTFASRYLPRFAGCQEFVNADLIAADLSPLNPESQSAVAGRLMLDRINELSVARPLLVLRRLSRVELMPEDCTR